MTVEQFCQLVGVAFLRGVEDAPDRAAQFGGLGIALFELAREQFDRLVSVFLGDLMHGAASGIGLARIESAVQGFAHRVDVAALRCREHLFAQRPVGAFALDMRLELAPACRSHSRGQPQAGRTQVLSPDRPRAAS